MLGWPVRMYRCAWSSEAGEIPALSRNGGSQASGEDEWDEPGRLDPRVRISPRLKGTRRLQVAAQRLIGIGVGPGDPELITIKAIQALQGSAPILVPATEASAQGPGRAETIFRALGKVEPSHLADTALFDFASLGAPAPVPRVGAQAWLAGGGHDST